PEAGSSRRALVMRVSRIMPAFISLHGAARHPDGDSGLVKIRSFLSASVQRRGRSTLELISSPSIASRKSGPVQK
ncbi:MAG: hypothetical protein LW837_21385, partial [Roseomonas sp.]|nr:hypothetical protein [Roseomonas sp.]